MKYLLYYKWALDFKQLQYLLRIMDIQGENKYGDAFFNIIVFFQCPIHGYYLVIANDYCVKFL